MHDKLYRVGTILINYSTGVYSRLAAVHRIVDVGYTQQEAMFVMDILQNPGLDHAVSPLVRPAPILELVGKDPTDDL